MKGLVSVIIPCYNAEKFISETLNSIYEQTYKNYEIILVDDGSTDTSALIAKSSFSEKPECLYIYQENKGVSSARNKGLQIAKGEFILFLDSDDIIEQAFLSSRVEFLSATSIYGLCGTDILTINAEGNLINNSGTIQAPDDNMLEQILLYEQPYASTPSNLLIRKHIMVDNNIYFEEQLSSTADKFFLCRLGKVTACKNIEGGKLLYRVVTDSMSHMISKRLLSDNLAYFKLLKQADIIPRHIYKETLLKNYYILAGLSFRLRVYGQFIYFYLKYLFVRLRVRKK